MSDMIQKLYRVKLTQFRDSFSGRNRITCWTESSSSRNASTRAARWVHMMIQRFQSEDENIHCLHVFDLQRWRERHVCPTSSCSPSPGFRDPWSSFITETWSRCRWDVNLHTKNTRVKTGVKSLARVIHFEHYFIFLLMMGQIVFFRFTALVCTVFV